MEDSSKVRIAKTEVRVQTAGIAILATIAIGATIKWLGPVLPVCPRGFLRLWNHTHHQLFPKVP